MQGLDLTTVKATEKTTFELQGAGEVAVSQRVLLLFLPSNSNVMAHNASNEENTFDFRQLFHNQKKENSVYNDFRRRTHLYPHSHLILL